MKKVLGLITGEIIIGPVEGIETDGGIEILIKQPYQAIGGNIMPFRIKDLGNAPGALQINPMNIIWSGPIEDFPEIETVYLKATTKIEVAKTPKIIL